MSKAYRNQSDIFNLQSGGAQSRNIQGVPTYNHPQGAKVQERAYQRQVDRQEIDYKMKEVQLEDQMAVKEQHMKKMALKQQIFDDLEDKKYRKEQARLQQIQEERRLMKEQEEILNQQDQARNQHYNRLRSRGRQQSNNQLGGFDTQSNYSRKRINYEEGVGSIFGEVQDRDPQERKEKGKEYLAELQAQIHERDRIRNREKGEITNDALDTELKSFNGGIHNPHVYGQYEMERNDRHESDKALYKQYLEEQIREKQSVKTFQRQQPEYQPTGLKSAPFSTESYRQAPVPKIQDYYAADSKMSSPFATDSNSVPQRKQQAPPRRKQQSYNILTGV